MLDATGQAMDKEDSVYAPHLYCAGFPLSFNNHTCKELMR